MEMSEWAVLLNDIRGEVLRQNLGPLDAEVVANLRLENDASSREVTLAYLTSLHDALRQASGRRVTEILDRLNQHVRMPDPQTEIDDIIVVSDPFARVTTGQTASSLRAQPDLDALAERLDSLLGQLRES